MDFVEEIRQLASAALDNESHYIVDVIVSSRKGPNKVLVIVDGDKGVTIDDCATLSRKLSQAMDDRNLLGENYVLEVSTPGLDQPLKLKRQYKKNIGRGLKVKLHDTILEGILSDVTDDAIVLTQRAKDKKVKEENAITVPFGEIDKAFVTISFK